ncbi:hypothetical protein SAMN05421820_103293 [Pedobacter steynii]|uniref:Uncharacterized protein n=1 Tax=Pedobacter steynii TaxID=430522 RepID=A0A1G9RN41_9SPHI|nr:hypothetical protein SAMN05421820_103293 [Pedobacter steynii]
MNNQVTATGRTVSVIVGGQVITYNEVVDTVNFVSLLPGVGA